LKASREELPVKEKMSSAIHEILREIPYGMYVVGVRSGDDGDFNALIVSWLTQCSFDPPLLMIAIRQGTRSYELVKSGRVFSVNLIDKSDQDLARQLVKPSDQVGDKLGTVAHVEEDTGAPILRKAFAYLECNVREIHEPGDHALVIGEIVQAGRHRAGKSLMCSDLHWHYAG
jgi:flavin reductase (DIM6/NTAB) family NADH-FMN oxidoreductase RutF